MNRFWMILLLSILLLACNQFADLAMEATPTVTSIPIGTISGKVIDSNDGTFISTANVSTEPPTSSVTTDGEGSFSIPDVPVGSYTVTATKSGYTSVSVKVAVLVDKTTTTDLHLISNESESTSTSPQADLAPDDGLVAYYPFDGNARDESGHEHHGVVNGAILVPDRFDTPDSAYIFDGVDDYIEISDDDELDLTDHFTIAAWIFQHKQDRRGQRIVDKETAGVGDGFDFDTYGGAPSLNILRLCGNKCSGANTRYTFNEWHFVAVTVSGTKAYFYLDGKPDGEGEVGQIQKNSLSLFIGRAHIGCNGSCGLDNFFDGIIDDVRIYDRTFTDTEIWQLYEKEP